MGLGATVGADLLSVPFPKMVFDLAQAIAKGQTALDRSSLATLRVLAKTEFDYVPEIVEVTHAGDTTTAGGVTATGVAVVPPKTRSRPLTVRRAAFARIYYQ